MYRKPDIQHSIYEFVSPFGKGLDENNRWIKLGKLIPWDTVEKEYAANFGDDGAPAKPSRMAFGALVIKARLNTTDEETVAQITENPYLQWFIGLKEFQTTPPFDPSLMTHFRKRINLDLVDSINEETLRPKKKDDDEPPGSGTGSGSASTKPPSENKGRLIMDATCIPADIKYPTDVNLLNESRDKLDELIDHLHSPLVGKEKRPRTYRNQARKDFLNVSKSRKPGKKKVRNGIRKQLAYVKRNLAAVEKLQENPEAQPLTARQETILATIRKVYDQQHTMYQTRSHSVPDRIVSISQPHVRPIVRGKVNNPTEFGAKLSISLVDGYTTIERLSWDSFNESADLIPAIERYRERHGHYPEAVIVDKIYRNRTNIAYCQARGIRISGPKLGRPSKAIQKMLRQVERADASIRNAVEGKFGEGKRKYGLSRLRTKLKETCETSIGIALYVMNLERKLRDLLPSFSNWLFQSLKKILYRFFLLKECYVV